MEMIGSGIRAGVYDGDREGEEVERLMQTEARRARRINC